MAAPYFTFIETSALFPHWPDLKSAEVRSLVDLSLRLGTKVYTSALCTHECIQEASEKLFEALKKFDDNLSRLGYSRSTAPTPELVVNELSIVEKLKTVFKNALAEKNIDVLEVVLISQDGVFAHPDLRHRAQKEGIQLTTVTKIVDALSLLKGALDKRDQARLQAETQRLRDFIQGERDSVIRYVAENASVDPRSFGLRAIHEVKAIDLRDIFEVITEGFPEDTADGQRLDFGFAALMRIAVAGEYIAFPVIPGEVPLSEYSGEESAPEPLSPNYSLSIVESVYGIPIAVERVHDFAFGFQASAEFHQKTRQYANLFIQKIGRPRPLPSEP